MWGHDFQCPPAQAPQHSQERWRTCSIEIASSGSLAGPAGDAKFQKSHAFLGRIVRVNRFVHTESHNNTTLFFIGVSNISCFLGRVMIVLVVRMILMPSTHPTRTQQSPRYNQLLPLLYAGLATYCFATPYDAAVPRRSS